MHDDFSGHRDDDTGGGVGNRFDPTETAAYRGAGGAHRFGSGVGGGGGGGATNAAAAAAAAARHRAEQARGAVNAARGEKTQMAKLAAIDAAKRVALECAARGPPAGGGGRDGGAPNRLIIVVLGALASQIVLELRCTRGGGGVGPGWASGGGAAGRRERASDGASGDRRRVPAAGGSRRPASPAVLGAGGAAGGAGRYFRGGVPQSSPRT